MYRFILITLFCLTPQLCLAANETTGLTLEQLLQTGGSVMVVLEVLSVLTLTLILYCFFLVRPRTLLPPAVSLQATEALKTNNGKEIESLMIKSPGVISYMADAVWQQKNAHDARKVDAVRSAGVRALRPAKERIQQLANIGVIAPMLGLLGTVFGMINAFNTIAFASATSRASRLAEAISQAMVTTAAGLVVGITAFVFFYYFKERLGHVASKAEILGEAFLRIKN